MRMRTERSYEFPTNPDGFWSRIAVVDDYQRWWPWLRRFEGATLAVGETWQCSVQPPVPYSVDFAVHIDSITASSLVEVTITGDIVGRADLLILPSARGCRVALVSDLGPAKQTLRALSIAARPIVRFGHNWVLDMGAVQYRQQCFPAAERVNPVHTGRHRTRLVRR